MPQDPGWVFNLGVGDTAFVECVEAVPGGKEVVEGLCGARGSNFNGDVGVALAEGGFAGAAIFNGLVTGIDAHAGPAVGEFVPGARSEDGDETVCFQGVEPDAGHAVWP